jgi:adenylate kinase
MNKNKTIKIYFGGVQGVGKTTLARKLIENSSFVHYSTSDVLMQHFRVNDRKDLEKITIDQELRDKIFLEFYLKYPNLILDGHFKLSTFDDIFFNFFFFIDAPSSVILGRRKSDHYRERPSRFSSLEDIEEEKKRELFSARNFGIEPIVILNDDAIDKVVARIKRIFENDVV